MGRSWLEDSRRYWKEKQAREVREELATTGESVAGFARRKGISSKRIAYWRTRLGARAKPQFVAVTLPAGAPPGSIELSAGGVVVRVREGLDVEHVARLVEAIGRRVGSAC